MSQRKIKQVWVDKDVWEDVRELLPNVSDPERSRWLYKDKLLGDMERKLRGIGKGMGKKGSILDLFLLVIFLSLLGSIILVTYVSLSKTNDSIQANPDIPTEVKTLSQTNTQNYQTSFNGAYLMAFVLLSLATIALAALVRVHPIFIGFFLLAWVFLVFLGGIAANVYLGLAESSALADSAAGFTFLSNILTYLPFLIGIIGAVLAAVMFKTWSDQ